MSLKIYIYKTNDDMKCVCVSECQEFSVLKKKFYGEKINCCRL